MSLRLSDTRINPPDKNGDVMLATGGLYAPTIRYNQGTFYVVCTNIIHPEGGNRDISENFIVSSKDIWSDTWSDPVYFDFKGIDPSIFFDENGRSYIHGSAAPGPMTKIHLFEVDLRTGEKISEEKKIWDGTGGIYPEGPHLYKRDGWFYLLISEGGTHEGHMITVARSTDIWGPYESFASNPILTAKGTDEYIRYTGHCDMFQDKNGDWWGVCLGVRKDKGGRFIMGRETFITPGTWAEGKWPTLELVKSNPKGLSVQDQTSGITAKPLVDLVYIRDADFSKYTISGDGKDITLKASSIDLSHPTDSPTFIGKRQRTLEGASSVSVLGLNQSNHVKAGLACYKDEHRYVRMFYDTEGGAIVFEERNNAKKIHKTTKQELKIGDSLALRFEYTEQEYRLSYKNSAEETAAWKSLASVDTLELTDPDFVGPIMGIFALAEDRSAEVRFQDLKID